ncbi:hypothetical protein PMIN06_002073 [Paraphaeosphaeria minitans]|uniref:Uncharacterized protein n=1 Tax=Paraphaeosphaeria minitans TaxID=565426 RepID=A0A9P6GBW2_9PLEO|nr:hypothetical protein PMIN01_09234 [Paraphaeosphaeria minitans]
MSDYDRRITLQDERLVESDKRHNSAAQRLAEAEHRLRNCEAHAREQENREIQLEHRLMAALEEMGGMVKRREMEADGRFLWCVVLGVGAVVMSAWKLFVG